MAGITFAIASAIIIRRQSFLVNFSIAQLGTQRAEDSWFWGAEVLKVNKHLAGVKSKFQAYKQLLLTKCT